MSDKTVFLLKTLHPDNRIHFLGYKGVGNNGTASTHRDFRWSKYFCDSN